jgi:hypothetical protein
MREIKHYIKNKKTRNNVIRLDIGGEIKHYPILSFDYNITYNHSLNHLYVSTSQLIINTKASNLIFLLSDTTLTGKYTIYIGDRKFYGCFVISYSVNNDNITEFTISVDYLEIN